MFAVVECSFAEYRINKKKYHSVSFETLLVISLFWNVLFLKNTGTLFRFIDKRYFLTSECYIITYFVFCFVFVLFCFFQEGIFLTMKCISKYIISLYRRGKNALHDNEVACRYIGYRVIPVISKYCYVKRSTNVQQNSIFVFPFINREFFCLKNRCR